MQIAFRLAYSLVVVILMVLFVIFGTRTFYDEPEQPEYPMPTSLLSGEPPVYCDFDAQTCNRSKATGPSDFYLTLEEARRQYPEAVEALEEQDRVQREYQRLYDQYRDDLVDYRRNVFVIASVLGVAAVAAGLYLYRKVEAMPLGLLLGGIGVVIYGWVQVADEFDEIGEAPLFAAVGLGLAIVLAAGYWFLGGRRTPGAEGR